MDCQCKFVLPGVAARLSRCLGLALLCVGLGTFQPSLVAQEVIQGAPSALQPGEAMQGKVRISADGQSFVRGEGKTDGGASGDSESGVGEAGQEFVPWGFNYLGEFGKLVEETWDSDWARIERDFQEMRGLGANVVRIHLQYGTYMKGPGEYDLAQFDRLRKLLDLSADVGLLLDVTGLSCYRLEAIPAWYDALDEAQRWEAQADWWAMVAKTCAGHPGVFCYDLMNEPIVGGSSKADEPRWVGGELGGLYFVQRISQEAAGRTNADIAQAWVAKLTAAIREHDPETPITVGVIPWAFVWPNAKPLFYSPEVAQHLDFVSIHAYPTHGKISEAIAALAVYDIGKPLVVEETFPLNCTIDDLDQFIDGGRDSVDGWISHFFGYTIEEHAAGAEPLGTAPDAPLAVTVAEFFEYWRDKRQTMVTESAQNGSDQPQ